MIVAQFFAIQQVGTNNFLPEISGRAGYTHTEPVDATHRQPRLFHTETAARIALTYWRRGMISVHRYQDHFTGDYDETWNVTHVSDRLSMDMKVVPVSLDTQ